jgi:hypothetical protein
MPCPIMEQILCQRRWFSGIECNSLFGRQLRIVPLAGIHLAKLQAAADPLPGWQLDRANRLTAALHNVGSLTPAAGLLVPGFVA